MTEHQPETGDFATHLGALGRRLDEQLSTGWTDAYDRVDAWTSALSGPLPEVGAGTAATMDDLLEHLVPNGMRMATPYFWGWITSGPTTAPMVTATAAMVASPQRGSLTAWNLLEEQSLAWLADLCGLPEHFRGVYSSGGSTANLVALGAARQWAYEQIGIDPAVDGVGGGEQRMRPTIYASEQVHHTINRSAAVLGLGRSAMRIIPVTRDLRLDVAALQAQIAADVADGCLPIAVVGIAGSTDTGVVDPLREIAEVADEFRVWFHVDGAYGLPGILDPRVTPLYDGLERADSAIVDPHKWLNAPVGVAATFVRDRALLHRAFTQEPAAYLEGAMSTDGVRVSLDAMGVPYGDLGVELSAAPRGAQVWAILHELGRAGVRARIVADDDLARLVQRRAESEPRLQVLSPAVLSICCFRYFAEGLTDPDQVNQQILRRLARETPFIVSSTVVDGAYALRPCFINARTGVEHVEEFMSTVVRLGDELTT